ncbi:hypothetical protein [Algoriphagus namhaensis]
MKAKFLFLSVIILSISACSEEDQNLDSSLEGNYMGTFERGGNSSSVQLTLNNSTWSGESERVKFPALCNGTYTTSANVITFVNACPWTAEFDWTLILGGDWNYSLNENTLIMTKANGDRYSLSKQ